MDNLQDFIKGAIKSIKTRQLDSSITEFKDTKTKYIVPKSTVVVEVALKEGLIAKIDVTNYFKEEL